MSVLRTVYSRNILKRACLLRTLGNTTINYAKDSIKVTEVFDEENKPIKYTATPAMKWQAKYSRIGTMDIRLWYEPYVVILSISIFLIYFCILREENDIDADLAKSLYEKIPGLEEQQLHVILRYNQEHGLETRDIIARLEKIRASKST